jgi:hypothetical protein
MVTSSRSGRARVAHVVAGRRPHHVGRVQLSIRVPEKQGKMARFARVAQSDASPTYASWHYIRVATLPRDGGVDVPPALGEL